MIAIAGYNVQAKLYESSRSIVYRGQDLNGRTVILKVMQTEQPTREEQERFQSEYDILSRLDLPGVIKAYALDSYQNRSVLVLEDIKGDSLKRWLEQHSLSLKQFLRIAIATARSLGQVHAAQIIHKDINPDNIILSAQAGLDDRILDDRILDDRITVQLIDFGNASLMRREIQTLHHPVSLEGRLAYLSPEQTGRMNRSLDYRTDFYSLGATWYEALTGRPPFTADDAMQIVYFHLAKQPPPPHQLQPQIPEMLSEIVLKLLAKNAEDRYQSAEGIQADLQICLSDLEQQGQISRFVLAQQDRSGRFQIPAKLYGRAAELEQLWASFERISTQEQPGVSQRELMLVSGYAGIGKSTLVQELYRPITAQRGYLIAGKFDQLQRNLPYSALVTALTDLVRQLLSEPAESLQVWKTRFLQALGANAQIIIDVIPEFRLVVGDQPDLPNLGLAESKNRFDRVFQNFVRVCCTPDQPLVIFLDDLQWADAASLNWIKLILSDPTIQHLLIIAAYRDREAGDPLLLLLRDLQQTLPISQIHLRPLDLEQVGQLVAETLQADITQVLPLAQQIMQQTGGNPFFVREFLKTLYAEQILSFDTASRQWHWQLERIASLGISDNVVDLMLNRLAKLPTTTRQILALAACIGPKFDAQTLSIICECPTADLTQPLAIGLESELIGATAKTEPQRSTYRFSHDRVQQAAYSLIPASEQQATHLKIGQLLLQRWDRNPQGAQIFQIVDHLNLGWEGLAQKAQVELAELNLKAAQRAKQATAYSAAQAYLRTGLSCLGPELWQQNSLALSLHQELAEVNYLLGDFAAAKTAVQAILQRATSPIDQAEAYNLLIIQETVRSQYAEAIQAGRAALKLLGVELPEQNLAAVFAAEHAKLKASLQQRPLADWLELPEITAASAKLVIKLLSNLGSAAYRYQQQLWQVVVVLSLNFCYQYGNSPESCYGYSNYGTLLGSVLGNYEAGYESCLVSLRLSERYGNLTQKTRACFILSNFVHAWVRPVQQADAINREGIQAGLESGEIQYVGYSLSYRITNLFFQGKPLSLLKSDLLEAVSFCQRSQNQWAMDALSGYQLTLFDLLDDPADPVWQTLPAVDPVRFPELCAAHQSFSGLCRYQILTCLRLYLEGQLREALAAAEAAENLLPYILGVVSIAEQCFYHSLVLTGLYASAAADEQAEFYSQLVIKKRQLQGWAEHCPANFYHLDKLVEAEMARLNGHWEAVQAYDQAIQAARQQGFVLHEALANDCAAQFWISHDKPDFARLYLRQAHREYRRWGANRKVLQLETRFPQSFSAKRLSSQDETLNQSVWSELLDLETLLKASQAISSEIVLSKLLGQLMTILIENAGAQRGYLLLPQQDNLQIEVEGESDRPEPIQVQSQPLSEALLPLSLISYVQRTGEAVVLGNATLEGRFRTDPYILDRRPQSLLGLPILNQGKLIGILYLENNLIAGAFTPERITILQVLSAQAAIALENASFYRTLEQKVEARTQELAQANQEITLLNQRLKTENLRMGAELAVARQIQQMILPKPEELEQIPLLDIFGFMEPADEVGGDYYDVLQTGETITIGIGDVTGHGLESGLLMLMLQTAIRTLVLAGETETVKFFQTLNQVIYENARRINSDRNLTLAVLDYELPTGRLRLSGQHEEILVVRADQQMQRIDTIDLGFPLGLVPEIEQFIDQTELWLNPGDGIVLYTDGIPEAANLANELYGLERLCRMICEFWHCTARDICEAVIQDLKIHIGEQKVFDDVTLLVVKRKPDHNPQPEPQAVLNSKQQDSA